MKILKILLLLYNSILILTLITIGLFTQPYNQLAPILLLIPVWLYFVLSLLDIFIVFAHLAYNQGILAVIKTLKYLRIYSFLIVTLMIIASLAYSSNSFESTLTFIFLPLLIYLILELFTKRTVSQFTVTNIIKVAKVVKKTEEEKKAISQQKTQQKEAILNSISDIKRKRFNMDSLDTGIAEIFSEYEAGASNTKPEKEQKEKITKEDSKELATKEQPAEGELREIEGEEVEFDGNIQDFRRRQFLKIVGGGGVSMFLMLFVFQQKASAAFFGSGGGPGIVGVKDSSGTTIDPAEKQPTDGYSIAELDDDATPSYYGFTHKTGSWYIAREDANGSYRYASGGTNFSTNWTNRASLTYDYFDNVF